MDMLPAFRAAIRSQSLFSLRDRLIVAVSGGIDSVVLTELCFQAGYSFSIAHCNFHLRDAESDRDQQFVNDLALKYNVPFFSRDFDTVHYSSAHQLSIQEAARELRYQWFEELIVNDNKGDVLLTAHHADDSIETVLMHFCRGTGLGGLRGIPAVNKFIKRPLLTFSRESIVAFARVHQLTHVEDSSNSSRKYTRNFFRNEILPSIEKVFPEVRANISANIERFKGIEKIYDFGVKEISKKLLRKKGNELHISVRELLKWNNRALVFEIIRPYGFTEKQVNELFRLAESDAGKYITSPAREYRIIRHRHWFIIASVSPLTSESFIIEEGAQKVQYGTNTLTIDMVNHPGAELVSLPSVAYLDPSRITYPLLLRKWRTADYFYPFGMTKKKKVSRFLIDRKASTTEKENTWVIESDNRIIWVVAQRIDNRFSVKNSSAKVLRLMIH